MLSFGPLLGRGLVLVLILALMPQWAFARAAGSVLGASTAGGTNLPALGAHGSGPGPLDAPTSAAASVLSGRLFTSLPERQALDARHRVRPAASEGGASAPVAAVPAKNASLQRYNGYMHADGVARLWLSGREINAGDLARHNLRMIRACHGGYALRSRSGRGLSLAPGDFVSDGTAVLPLVGGVTVQPPGCARQRLPPAGGGLP